MQKTTALFLALMGLSICSFGQKNYQPGSILRNNGDSERGLIDYRNWPKNPKTVLFKAPNAEPVEYGISDLAAFNVYGLDRYQKAVVTKDMRPVSMDANDLSLMTANSDLN